MVVPAALANEIKLFVQDITILLISGKPFKYAFGAAELIILLKAYYKM